MKLNRTSAIILTAAIVLALLTWGFWPAPLVVEVGIAEHATLRVTIEEEGSWQFPRRWHPSLVEYRQLAR